MSKKLYRPKEGRVIGGVCLGLAEYFNIDPVIIRIIFIVGLITEGFGLMVYIVLWIVMPEEGTKKVGKEVIMENEKEIVNEIKKATKGIKKEVKSDTKKK